MKKVCVVITARPSYSRCKSVLTALQRRPDVELQVIAAASALTWRHGRVVDQIREDGFPVSAEIASVVEGGSTLESVVSTGLLLSQLPGVLRGLEPDVVVTVADRHETIATAIAASYLNIPLCHIQGGEVSGNIDDRVRNAISQLADIHCVATRRAAVRVAEACKSMRRSSVGITDEGTVEFGEINDHVPVGIYQTGCPSIDLAREAFELCPLPGHDVVVLQHPVTDEEHLAGAQMRETIKALKGFDDVLWLSPGEDAGADAMREEMRLAGIEPKGNLPPLEFLRMLLGSGVLVGNSSVGIRECSFLGVPVVNIGTRQEGRERASNVYDVLHSAKSIFAGVEWQCHDCKRSTLYGDGHAGERIAEILANGAEKKAA